MCPPRCIYVYICLTTTNKKTAGFVCQTHLSMKIQGAHKDPRQSKPACMYRCQFTLVVWPTGSSTSIGLEIPCFRSSHTFCTSVYFLQSEDRDNDKDKWARVFVYDWIRLRQRWSPPRNLPRKMQINIKVKGGGCLSSILRFEKIKQPPLHLYVYLSLGGLLVGGAP